MIFIIILILLVITIYSTYRAYKIKQEVKEINKEIEEENKKIEQRHDWLTKSRNELEQKIQEETAQLQGITLAIQNSQNASEQTIAACQQAFEQYREVLENHYQKVNIEYDQLIRNLGEAYNTAQDQIIEAIAKEKNILDNYKNTRAAAMQAQLKEQEIKEKLEFYCLHPSENDKDDIKELERVKPKLHSPRILSMLIWSTYFQKSMTALCNNILGTSIVCGIYKVTNQKTNMCYIGQAADVAKRWKDHAKCGLGIDTPANNKLYKAMQEDGLWNFSWELLEACSRDLLNEKEAFYIDLYDSCAYGYNSNNGIKKS